MRTIEVEIPARQASVIKTSQFKLASKSLKRHWQLYLLIIPPVLYFIIFKYIPISNAILAFIESYVSQNSLQFITGSKSLDKDWDAYVKGLDQLGLPRYLQIQQEAYDKSSYKK